MNPIPDILSEDVENGRVPLGRLLVEAGLLTDAQVEDALFEGGQTGERLGEIAVRRGMLSEEDLAKTLAEQWSLSYVDRASIFFDAGALARLSREDAQRLEAMPTRVQDGRVVVAVAEPTEQRLQALREVIGEDTVMVVVPRAALDAALSSELLTSRTPAAEREASPAARGEAEADAEARFRASPGRSSRSPPAYREQTEPTMPLAAAAAGRERRSARVPDRSRRLSRPGLHGRGRGAPPPRPAARERARTAERRRLRSAAPPAGRTPPPLFLIPRLGDAVSLCGRR